MTRERLKPERKQFAADSHVPAQGGTLDLSTQSARHDDSVSVVHAVQVQQIAVHAGPHA